jgi:hypothetical protein
MATFHDEVSGDGISIKGLLAIIDLIIERVPPYYGLSTQLKEVKKRVKKLGVDEEVVYVCDSTDGYLVFVMVKKYKKVDEHRNPLIAIKYHIEMGKFIDKFYRDIGVGAFASGIGLITYLATPWLWIAIGLAIVAIWWWSTGAMRAWKRDGGRLELAKKMELTHPEASIILV